MPRPLLVILAVLFATPLAAERGMVSAADPRGAAAGVEMLRRGGSAVDAAIATMLALNVVEPQSAGIGGGGFLLHADARSRRLESWNGREKAPAAADSRWFYGSDCNPLTKREAIPGGRSVGVPGAVALAWAAHRARGRLPWAQLFEPAIRLARDGFTVSARLHAILAGSGGHVDAGARYIYFDADRPKATGSTARNPELAAFLTRLAREGPAAFYRGANARAIVAAVNGAARNPSMMTVADLSGYDARRVRPVCGAYRAYRICGMGPPSSGGVAVLAVLKQLERFDLAALGSGSPVAWHLLAESERLAYADRDRYLADRDHVAVPVAGLTDPAYLAHRAALISPERTMPEVTAGVPDGAPPRRAAPSGERAGTTHIVAVDGRGDVASLTATIESPFGSGLIVNGYFLNNQLTDFDLVPERDGRLVANRVEGGKRPRSSMAPTIVYGPDGAVRLAIGAAGGSTIIAQVAKAIVAVVDWRMSAQDAIALGLVFAPGRTAYVEAGTELAALAAGMAQLGEPVQLAPLGLKANAVEQVDGRWLGAADPRTEGVAMAADGTIQPIVRRAREAPPE